MMAVIADDPFFTAVTLAPVILPSTGESVQMPIRYRDFSTFAAVFPAQTAALRPALPSPRLVPQETAPGTGSVIVAAYDHRHTDLAPYHELAVWIPVSYQSDDPDDATPGLYCHFLPVTTEEARVIGVDLWGFPKFVAEIALEEGDGVRRCRVRADGRDIVGLETVDVPVATELDRVALSIFTVKAGNLLRTSLVSEGYRGQRADGEGARLVLGDHSRAESLRHLGLEAATAQSRGEHLKMLLPEADRVLPL